MSELRLPPTLPPLVYVRLPSGRRVSGLRLGSLPNGQVRVFVRGRREDLSPSAVSRARTGGGVRPTHLKLLGEYQHLRSLLEGLKPHQYGRRGSRRGILLAP
ncbi:MAG: hypothetical protein QME77_09455 [bacterium]|nr:hypothetical protein [bacterium]